MRVYEIDTGHLEAKKGATIIKMVTIQDMLERIKELGKNKIEDEDGVEIKYWHFDESDLSLLEKELEKEQ